MENETVNASVNPGLANKIIDEVMNQTAAGVLEELTPASLPPDTHVDLLAGFYDPITGEHTMTAEVRELNGADEEALSRIGDVGKMLMAVLNRGVIKIGDTQSTADMLDDLLAGDRELLLLAIRKATFGAEIELSGPCPLCAAPDQEFKIDLNSDVEMKGLEDPIGDRIFPVKIKSGEIVAQLPTGHVQKKLISSNDKTGAELDTLMLKECVLSINGNRVLDVKQIKQLGIGDRRKVTEAISKRNPGPQLADIKKTCSACGQEVPLPLTLADLFRL